MSNPQANVRIGGEATKYTKEQIKNASEDAGRVIAAGGAVRAMCMLMRSSRQMYLVGRQQLDREIKYGWEVQLPELVTRILVESEERLAVDKPWTVETLRDSLRDYVIPVLNLVIDNEKEANHGKPFVRGEVLPAPADAGQPQPAAADDAGAAGPSPDGPGENCEERRGADGEAGRDGVADASVQRADGGGLG